MPKAGRYTGPTLTGSAVDRLAQREAAAAEARQAEERAREHGAARYAMSRAEVDAHHGDLRWVLETAIGYALSGDEEMADFTLRHAVHVGVPVVTLAGALADLGAMRDASRSGS